MNRVDRLEEFMARWDVGVEGLQPPPVLLKVGASGQINDAGTDYCNSGQILTSSHPRFLDCIEPSVRDLVSLLTNGRGLITYSSCEGHPQGSGGSIRIREVGIIPRNGTEYLWALRALANAARSANCMKDASAVFVRIAGTFVMTTALPRPAIDVQFANRDIHRYFADVDEVYQTYLAALQRCNWT